MEEEGDRNNADLKFRYGWRVIYISPHSEVLHHSQKIQAHARAVKFDNYRRKSDVTRKEIVHRDVL